MTFPKVTDNALQFAHWNAAADRFILRDSPNTNESIGESLANQLKEGESVDGQQLYLKAVYRDSTVSAAASRTRELFVAQYDATGQGRIERIDTLHSSNAGNEVNWPENTDIALYSVNPAEIINSMRVEDTTIIGAVGAPAFENGWQNFGGDFPEAGFYKAGDRVHLRGLIKGGTLGLAIFTLPVGYRPESRILFSTISSGSAARLDVANNGVLLTQSPTVSNAWLSLDGLSFRAAP